MPVARGIHRIHRVYEKHRIHRMHMIRRECMAAQRGGQLVPEPRKIRAVLGGAAMVRMSPRSPRYLLWRHPLIRFKSLWAVAKGIESRCYHRPSVTVGVTVTLAVSYRTLV